MAVNDIYDVVQTPQAEEHLRQITYYIAVKLKNPGAADAFLDKVEMLDEYLMYSPHKCAFTDVEPWDNLIHKTVIEDSSYNAYFWIDEDSLKVYIVGYSYMGQNQDKCFSSLDI